MSLFEFIGIPNAVQVLLYTFSILLIVGFFISNADFGIFKIPEFNQRQRRVSLIVGIVLLFTCILASFPYIEPRKEISPNARKCEPRIFSIGGSLNGLNEIGRIDSFSSKVVKGGNFTLRITLRDNIDTKLLSCVHFLMCKPQSANQCITRKSFMRPLFGTTNVISMIVGDTFESGIHRIHVKLFKVKNASELTPLSDGSYNLSDYKLFGESRDFEVK